jgi:hypothetical protein
MPEKGSENWISLEDAARRLGVSRLRIREAIAAEQLPARRDNRGFWQVSLDKNFDAKGRFESERLDPEALVELLFDEIEEVNLVLADREASLERLNAVASRQQEMIARMLSLAEGSPADGASADTHRLAEINDRMSKLIETALEKLASRDGDIVKLTGLLDRALTTIAGLESELQRQAGLAERQKGLFERLFALADASLERFEKSEGRSRGLIDRLRSRFAGGSRNQTDK